MQRKGFPLHGFLIAPLFVREIYARQMTSVMQRKTPAFAGSDKEKETTKDRSSEKGCDSEKREWVGAQLCARAESPLYCLRPLMKVLEISCHGIPWLLGTLTTLLCVQKAKHVEVIFNLFVALLFDILVVIFFKLIFKRNRPKENKMDMFFTVSVDSYSFPSGHATRAAMLAYFFTDKVFSSTLPKCFVVIWSVLVSLSRVLLGRHYISDVVCGNILGIVEYLVVTMYLSLSQKTCIILLEPYLGKFNL